MYRWSAELGCAEVQGAGEGMSGWPERMEQERLARLAALGVPLVQPEQLATDIIEQAVRLRGMNRATFVRLSEGRGFSLEDYAREVILKAAKPETLIDRWYIERARQGYRRWH
ncbi:hypothetical protein ACN8ZM_06880 [Burkholderia aenigmatica]|uniref:hypothetical protein n=1 Tax=Burkholderia aenigmatica TaxID=2015348 RepID=UPI003B42F613